MASVNPPILVRPDGFSAFDQSVQWQEIQEIVAYKVDLLTVDEVRLSIAIASGSAVVVSEEQPGFSELVVLLTGEFPCLVDCEGKILQPAFARNETVLYRRA